MKAFRPQLIIFVFSCLLSLAACDDQRVYEENYDFADKVWHVDSVPSFRFEISEPNQQYNIYWNVRNASNYPFRNLYVTYFLEDTLGRTISTDLHNMLLFDPKTGKPYGSGMGDIFSHQIMALPEFEFDSAGTYQIRLEQFMRTDSLKEVLSIGVRVEKAE
ncbi:gliding motility lipoprotein GldH [Porifericola rhodea]|uniref:gliding motility lipoprotein GldH n=1 Tax=Porifericola rhodea TaxID=930972 RepID=UPI002665D1FD|nr:gliding motility lipoprotein GldH [Porifericola rhodea]WKN30963.1 gliding motility lipoprotein GldH [Porifericola rhodea]